MASMDCLEDQVLKEKQAAKEKLVHQEIQVIQDHLELVDKQGEMDQLDPQETKGQREIKEIEYWVIFLNQIIFYPFFRVSQEVLAVQETKGQQVHLGHLDHPGKVVHKALQDLKGHLVLLEGKENLELQALLGQLDQLVVMESLAVMAGMVIEGNKELLVHKDQE